MKLNIPIFRAKKIDTDVLIYGIGSFRMMRLWNVKQNSVRLLRTLKNIIGYKNDNYCRSN